MIILTRPAEVEPDPDSLQYCCTTKLPRVKSERDAREDFLVCM